MTVRGLGPLAVALTLGLGACQGAISEPRLTEEGEPTGPGSVIPGDCATPQRFFETNLWPRIFEARCIMCHTRAGSAAMSAFQLVTPTEEPDTHLATNFERVSHIAAMRVAAQDHRSLLELKPTAAVMHGGATVLPPGGDQHQLLVDFIARLDGVMCDPSDLPPLDFPYYDNVTFTEPVALLRRVTLSLGARLPTDAERASVEASGLTAMEPILDDLLSDEPFIDRVKEGFNDIFLTRGYEDLRGGVLARPFFTNRDWPEDIYVVPELYEVNRIYDLALREEPIELIAHIVRNDRPFTEILTADYTVMSPYSARGYGVFDDVRSGFFDEDDPFEYIEARLPRLVSRYGPEQVSPTGLYPHAGLLTTPMFLHRYESTDTNRNRGRARVFFDLFLGFDIMASATAVTDSAAVTAMFPNPTMESPDCVACHRTLDPVAGLFQEYNNDGEFHFREEDWFTDMFPPGYQDEVLPASELWQSLSWLGERAAADPRFPVAMAEHVYYILTQDRVMLAPQEGDPMAQMMRRGYEVQREAITEAALTFEDSGFNLKVLFKSLIMSDFYRATSVSGIIEDVRRTAELEALGLGSLLTPEQLIRKTRAIFGVGLPIDPTDPDQKRSTYLLYGGLDYAGISERASVPSGSMGALMRIHANSVACRSALREFWDGTVGPYPLFPHVDENTTDEGQVRDNLVWLHDLILGQRLAADSPEIDRSYQLFDKIVSEGAARVAAGDEDIQLIYECRAEQTVPDDDDYVMRGWQAVLTYLLRRPEYLLQ